MTTVLHVGAIIDSHTPAAWAVQLLCDVQSHSLMQLHVGVHELEPQVAETMRPSLADQLIKRIIDKPNFTHDPWKVENLPEGIVGESLGEHPAALAQCDVTLNLTGQALPTPILESPIPLWGAELGHLDRHIRDCLLTRAPFIWIHLWNHVFHTKTQATDRDRIASHSLPCQTYSISDLRRLTYSALPRVFLSRLIWLANSESARLDPIDTQERNLGVFDAEQSQARRDAVRIDDTSSADTHGITLLMQAVKLLFRQTSERIRNRFVSEHWQLAVLEAPDGQAHTLQEIGQTPIEIYRPVAEPGDVMWADPHLCEYEGDTYVFFEKMHVPNTDAHIAYARLDKTGRPVESGTAISADHHLSFPFVLCVEDSQYMIPETGSQDGVMLYKARHFPDQWEPVATLLSGINAADTVVHRHAGRWWMFTNCQSHRCVDERDELHIYYADELTGPWHAHSLNPVLTGVDRSRMAGPVTSEEGKLYRSSQYGAYRYGYGINISRIEELTPEIYRESALWRMLPKEGAGWSGCHSLDRMGNLTIIDRVRFSRS